MCSCSSNTKTGGDVFKPAGLLLNELGGYLLPFNKAPSGTKRISNLLPSPKWEDKVITDYLAAQGQN